MSSVLILTAKIHDIANYWNANLVFIQTDGKSARIKVQAQNITTPEILIHEGISEEEIKVKIGFAIRKTQGVTNTRI